MSDQAAGLRNLFARRRPSLLIVAGSDPAKAAVAMHFARDAAASGRATLIVDGTAGQLARACEIACKFELSHVVAGDLAMTDVVRALTPHLLLLPAARALSRFGSFRADEQARLVDAFSNGITQALAAIGSEPQIDLIVVNAEQGRATRAVEAFGRDARVVIVASEQGASLRGAYGEMKALSQLQGLEHFEIVAPRSGSAEAEATGATAAGGGVAFNNLAAVARRFLDIELVDGGSIVIASARDARRGAPEDSASASRASLSPSEEEAPHAAVA